MSIRPRLESIPANPRIDFWWFVLDGARRTGLQPFRRGCCFAARTRAASVVAANAPSPHRAPPVSMGRGPPLWGRSAFNCSLTAFERGCRSPPIQALALRQSPSNSTGRGRPPSIQLPPPPCGMRAAESHGGVAGRDAPRLMAVERRLADSREYGDAHLKSKDESRSPREATPTRGLPSLWRWAGL
jgi:hypothetical protein